MGGIDTIEYAKTADAVCISIDDPEHLYVTRDFIVTHNTYCALQASADLKGRIVISIEKRFFNLWEEALCPGEKQILDLKEDEVLFISGSKELKALMELAIEDKLQEIKVIIIAARTLGIFFETYERYGKYILITIRLHQLTSMSYSKQRYGLKMNSTCLYMRTL